MNNNTNNETHYYYPSIPFATGHKIFAQMLEDYFQSKDDVLQWLCKTPTLTTYRIINKQIPFSDLKEEFLRLLDDLCIVPPEVFQIPWMPEVIVIGPIRIYVDGKYNLRENINTIIKYNVVITKESGINVLRGNHIWPQDIHSMENFTTVHSLVRVFMIIKKKSRYLTANYSGKGNTLIYVGIGRLCMRMADIFSENPPLSIAIKMISTISGVPSIGNVSNSSFILQSLPTVCCAKFLNPQPSELILEICSSPGEKTAHLAELMNKTGIICTIDGTMEKVKRTLMTLTDMNMAENVRSFLFNMYNVYARDGVTREAILRFPKGNWKPPFACYTFDRVLLNAPSSRLGRRPCFRSCYNGAVIKYIPNIQKILFTNAVAVLKVGGTLIYCTDTINPMENEGIVAWALNTFPNLLMQNILPKIGSPALPYVGLKDIYRNCVQRFGPNITYFTDLDTDGYFIAKFIKVYEDQ